MLAFSAVAAVASKLTFSRVRPSRSEAANSPTASSKAANPHTVRGPPGRVVDNEIMGQHAGMGEVGKGGAAPQRERLTEILAGLGAASVAYGGPATIRQRAEVRQVDVLRFDVHEVSRALGAQDRMPPGIATDPVMGGEKRTTDRGHLHLKGG
jgi:hypothetical protein